MMAMGYRHALEAWNDRRDAAEAGRAPWSWASLPGMGTTRRLVVLRFVASVMFREPLSAWTRSRCGLR